MMIAESVRKARDCRDWYRMTVRKRSCLGQPVVSEEAVAEVAEEEVETMMPH